MDLHAKAPRSWLRRLCKLADAICAAEDRRLAARTLRECLEAEVELDAAFKALYRYYLRFPFPIRVPQGSHEKVRRLIGIWSRHLRRPQ